MFLKINKSKGKSYLHLVESYRDEKGTPKHQILVSLGNLDNFTQSSLESLSNAFRKLAKLPNVENVKDMEYIESYNWGAYEVIKKIWNILELDRVIDETFLKTKITYNAKETIFNIVLNRLTHPDSKLKIYTNQDKCLGIREVELHHYYRVLDQLADHKIDLEKSMFKNSTLPFRKKVNVILYDVTTLYFESVKPNELSNFGYSKDGKYGETQVVVGLTTDQDGRALSVDIYPGNTYEGGTILNAVNKVKETYNVEKVVVIADRGMNSKNNLDEIRQKNLSYIISARFKTFDNDLKKKVLDNSDYEIELRDEKDKDTILLKSKEIKIEREGYTDRYICTWSLSRSIKDKKDRERLLKKANALIEDHTKLKDKRGAKKYINYNLVEENLEINKNKIYEDSQFDGFYVIQTNDTSLSRKEIISSYRSLWKIEESFRVFKHNLHIRPMYHWTPKRIIGHILCCFIAFNIERALESILTKKKIEYSVEKIQEALNQMNVIKLKNNNEIFYLYKNLKNKESTLARNILQALCIDIPNSYVDEKNFNKKYNVVTTK